MNEDHPSNEKAKDQPRNPGSEQELVPENKLEPVIKDLPVPKQQEIKQIIREIQRDSTLAVIERGSMPRIDAETSANSHRERQ